MTASPTHVDVNDSSILAVLLRQPPRCDLSTGEMLKHPMSPPRARTDRLRSDQNSVVRPSDSASTSRKKNANINDNTIDVDTKDAITGNQHAGS